ncbi:conserved exported protein of unknown function [Nitrospira sp. KM1]|uniref:hypothetical protein n=1 Tax=Nitrospira sp. KM1 TaxID=1936990 RepID=UPI0013A743C7|nr:hypothetical protein [Nitrospira sp. KM1]BCA53399.1 conserved exported protein of unknown function [Nitrospira sp. KM1]
MMSLFTYQLKTTTLLIGWAAMGLVVTGGCSTTAKVAQNAKGQAYLEEVTDWSFEASHPSVIDQATMMKVVKGLYSEESQMEASRMSAGGSKPMRIFSDEDAESIVPLLTQSLAKAKPEQIVGFRLSSSAGSGYEPAAGSLYVQKGLLYITISRGALIKGFMPESVAHTEQAPSYAAAGSVGSTMVVVDYHALAKAPSAFMVFSQAEGKSQSHMSVASSPGQGKSQSGSPARGMSGFKAIEDLPETSQNDKVKELIAKKDLEINMLRKEADWMKRELRDRDEELKALKATKVSGKPAPKKKQAEVYPSR